MNPFDLRAALLAKHAQHVVLIHFPIALFIAGVNKAKCLKARQAGNEIPFGANFRLACTILLFDGVEAAFVALLK